MGKSQGLTQPEADSRLKEYGLNILPETPPTPDLIIFLRQIKSPLIYILLIAGAVSFFLQEISDAIVIMLAVVVNTVLGFYQERKAEHGLQALKKILTPHAKVIRDGQIKDIDARRIVPGDIVILAAGDRVPADGIVIEASQLTINEAVLTGESLPVVKAANADGTWQSLEKHAKYTAFMGTTVVGGVGRLCIANTGVHTEIGKIAQSLSEAEESETPLQKRIGALARTLTIVVVVAALAIFGVGLLRQQSFTELFTTSVAVAVAAIPEGLVIALTTILALGMQRILKRKALVRKLVVAETLGTVTVIATDKTGTLTEGKLRVIKTDFTDKKLALTAAVLANQLVDPLEFALWEWLTAEAEVNPETIIGSHDKEFILPFDSDRKYSATSYKQGVYTLGAPDVLLGKSTLTKKEKEAYEKKISSWARQGIRVLGIGFKANPQGKTTKELKHKHDIDDMAFLGLVGFADPVRKGVKEALSLCHEAGIAIKVVTGDYQLTAQAVMEQVGMGIPDPAGQILAGTEIARLSPEQLKKRVKEVRLFARVTPAQKLKIVEALKKNNEVVALLGDGVNDAPAIKRADIGVVVDDATDVAKDTADLVLLDSNFSTIVAAVEEGRGIFVNIQKVMTYLLGDTFAEVTLILLGLIFNVPLPLTAAQILWINLVTDTFPTLALTLEPKEKDLLKRPPIASNIPILGRSIVAFMLVASLTSGISIFLLFVYLLQHTGDVFTARLVVFTAFSIKSLVYVFSLRNRNQMLWQIPLLSNPGLILAVFVSLLLQIVALYAPPFHDLLDTRVLMLHEWIWVTGVSILILLAIEGAKMVRLFVLPRLQTAQEG